MTANSENNKRIAKNTTILYVRMLFTMVISLFTSRIVLNTLGVTDFGIYNVVGGMVTLFAFLNSSMAISVQRFFSFQIGKGDMTNLDKIFSMSVIIHSSMSIIIFLLAETIGLYLLYNYINIPPERENAVFWAYQWSAIACCISFNQIPYNALIISNEKMSAFAYISIVETIMQLLIVYFLVFISIDKLSLYGFLRLIIVIIITASYIIYCNNNFKNIRCKFYWNKSIFKELISFASWSAFGELAWVMVNQGVNIVLNIFFSPVVNASRGIAFQVNSAVNKFVQNFQTALNPQIIKNYASGNIDEMIQLTYRGTRFSFYMLLLLSLPILLNTQYILELWLGNVPPYCVEFCQLAIITSLIDSLSNVFATVAKAYGKIRKYQMIVSFILMLNLPFTWICFKLGATPSFAFYIYSIMSFSLIFIRLYLLKKMVGMKVKSYIKEVIYPILLVISFSIILPLMLREQFSNNLLNFLSLSFISVLSVLISLYMFGLKKSEKKYINSRVLLLIKRTA